MSNFRPCQRRVCCTGRSRCANLSLLVLVLQKVCATPKSLFLGRGSNRCTNGRLCNIRRAPKTTSVKIGLGPVVVQDRLQGPLCGNRRECVLSGEGSSCGAPVAPGDGFFCGCKLQPFQVPLVRRLMSRREYSPVANKPDQIIQRFSPDHPTNPPS